MKLPKTFRTEFSHNGEVWTCDLPDMPSGIHGHGKSPAKALKSALRLYKSYLKQAARLKRSEEKHARRNGKTEAAPAN